MAQTREARLIHTINRRLPKEIHHESCTSPFRKGTPDQYYEGAEGVARIEYKYIHAPKLPKTISLSDVRKKYGMSVAQNEWLTRAFYNNIQVAVVLATSNPEEVFMVTTPKNWEMPWTRGSLGQVYGGIQVTNPIVNRTFIAQWIVEHVT